MSGQIDFHLSKDSDDNGYMLYILEKNYKVYNIFQFHFNLNLLKLENLTWNYISIGKTSCENFIFNPSSSHQLVKFCWICAFWTTRNHLMYVIQVCFLTLWSFQCRRVGYLSILEQVKKFATLFLWLPFFSNYIE